MNSRRLELIVFLCGAAVMALEMTGSRMLAPYLGTSVFIWTSLIGIILASLSLGYWWGGKLSDRDPNTRSFGRVIFIAGLSIGVMAVLQEAILTYIQTLRFDVRTGAVLASIVLFAVPAVLLGMVSPYAVRLKITAVGNSGSTVGNLYALSTLGSIVGTFLAGFFLIAWFPTHVILYVLSLVIVATSFLADPRFFLRRTVWVLFLGLGTAGTSYAAAALRGPDFIEANTLYNRVWIYDSVDPKNGRAIKVMNTNSSRSSAMYLENDDLVFTYNRYLRLARHFKPSPKHALVIGGAGYSYPRDFLKTFPKAKLDVVEIDPGLTEIARRHFRLQDDPRLRIFHEDGRIFLNHTTEKYDIIVGDAFHSVHSIPFHLTTLENARALYDRLEEDGVVLMNIISAIEGKKGRFLRAEYRTFKEVFPQVYVFATELESSRDTQNIILVALKSKDAPAWESADPELAGYLENLWKEKIRADEPVLTDDFAPTDILIAPALPGYLQNESARRIKQNLWEYLQNRKN